jgi:hypothetical protein
LGLLLACALAPSRAAAPIAAAPLSSDPDAVPAGALARVPPTGAARVALPTTRLIFEQRIGERSERVVLDLSARQAALLDAEGAPTLLLDRQAPAIAPQPSPASIREPAAPPAQDSRRQPGKHPSTAPGKEPGQEPGQDTLHRDTEPHPPPSALVMLDPAERVYWPLGPTQLLRMAAEIRAAMQRARSDLLHLDDEAREQAERALGEMLGAPPSLPLHLAAQAERARIAGLPCQWHALHREGRPVGRVCAARPGQVPGGEGWLSLLQALATAHDTLTRLTAGELPAALPAHPWLGMVDSGLLPLRWWQPADGRPGSEAVSITLQRIEMLDLPPHTVPADHRDGFDPP